MPGAAERRKPALKLGDLRPKDVLTVVENRGNRLFDAVAQALALRGKVDEGGNGLRPVVAHAISPAPPWRILAAEWSNIGA